ncbi:MAG: PEP-CTERM sorting domain-containing protein [Verrucomicrobiaceae bacterium]|nr:MAG: PEP-CTERM sorting domain-containing protein [Verrucomicrobiaceae bacterium]
MLESRSHQAAFHISMKILRISAMLVLLGIPSQAALSIVIEPGSTPDTTIFTVTQTSPSPLLDVAGMSGYAMGMSIPTAIFNVPGLGPGLSTDIYGILSNPVTVVTEFYSGQTFLLNQLRVSSDLSSPSLLGFDHLFTIPSGNPSLRFDVAPAAPAEINISYQAFHPGTYTSADTLFGAITITVIPEPSVLLLLGSAVVPLVFRRRKSA